MQNPPKKYRVFSPDQPLRVKVAAAIHDYMTSSRAYMLTHSRSEAEADFRRRLESVSNTMWRSIVGDIMGGITYSLSWAFWDVKKTRWK